MLTKIGALGGLLGSKIDHPLADSREMRRVLAELPADNGFKALDEVAGWLESLQTAHDFTAPLLFQVVRQLDEAAQPYLRRLARDYLQASRLSKAEEKRLWTIIHGVWYLLAASYERCLAVAATQGKPAQTLKSSLPLLCARLIATLSALNKWDAFHYGPLSPSLWARLGQACLVAEEAGVATLPVQLYPPQVQPTSVLQEYLKAMVFQASSMDCLQPFEMELAEKLIAHFLPHFIFGPGAQSGSVYWVDLAKDRPPMRLARMPREMSPGLRFFQPGGAHAELEKLVDDLERGKNVPPEINLGGQYHARFLLPVLRHLAAYLAPVPPQRRHDRHRVKHRVTVLSGFIQALAVFGQMAEETVLDLPMASWGVADVSLGGFGALVQGMPPEWLKVGALLALQPEGGDNWVLGIIRRRDRATEAGVRVGIEAIGRQVASVQLRIRAVSEHANSTSVPALWLRDGSEPGEMRFVLPPATFDIGRGMELDDAGQRILLAPVALEGQATMDYEVARYRVVAD